MRIKKGIKCEICGKDLKNIPHKSKYCSNKCRRIRNNYERLEIKNRPEKTICLNCQKEIKVSKIGVIPRFCSNICRNSYNYYRNPKKKIAYQKEYKKKFKERDKNKVYLSGKKWKEKNRIRVNELMRKNRKRNKEKFDSRDVTWDVLKCYRKGKVIFLDKRCKKCGSIENLEIHHEIYPTNRKQVREAIKEGKIYYLCRKHHLEIEEKIRNGKKCN